MTHQTATRQTASRRFAGLLTAALLAGLCAGLGAAQSQPAGPPPGAAAPPAGPPPGFPPMPPPGPTKHMPWGAPDVTGVWAFVFDGNVSPAGAVDFVHGVPEVCLEISAAQQQLPAEFTKWNGSMVRGTADGEVPYQPWARTKREKRTANLKDPPSEDFIATSARCLLTGMPGSMLRLNPHVYQFRDHILMEWEYPQMHRIIWTDGRSPPPAQVKLWQGFSVGRWDGDTLVVTTTNMTGFSWMDGTGDVMSENTKVTEYIKVQGSRLAYKVVVEDPTTYTQPWWMEWRFNILRPGAMPATPPDTPRSGAAGEKLTSIGLPTDVNALNAMVAGEMLELACPEGQRYQAMPTKAKKPAARSER